MDDDRNAARIAESILVAAASGPRVAVILDTFADADRGYFARTGLVDRRYNPRPASFVARHLVALLHTGDWRLDADTPTVAGAALACSAHTPAGDRLLLLLPRGEATSAPPLPLASARDGCQRFAVDLQSGVVRCADASVLYTQPTLLLDTMTERLAALVDGEPQR